MRKILFLIVLCSSINAYCKAPVKVNDAKVNDVVTKIKIGDDVYDVTSAWFTIEDGVKGVNGTIAAITKNKLKVYGLSSCYRSDSFSQNDIQHFNKCGIILSAPTKTLTSYKLIYDSKTGSTMDAVIAFNTPFLSQKQIDELNNSIGIYGIADIWIVSFNNRTGGLEHFIILDKIDLFNSHTFKRDGNKGNYKSK